jgi:hypothetical protein
MRPKFLFCSPIYDNGATVEHVCGIGWQSAFAGDGEPTPLQVFRVKATAPLDWPSGAVPLTSTDSEARISKVPPLPDDVKLAAVT